MRLIGMTGDYLHEPGPGGGHPRTLVGFGQEATVMFEMCMEITDWMSKILMMHTGDHKEIQNKRGYIVSEDKTKDLCYAVCRHDNIYLLVKLLVLEEIERCTTTGNVATKLS